MGSALASRSLSVLAASTRKITFRMLVNVKWNGKKFDNVELNTNESAVLFKNQLYSLTGVAPERQKIMIKGGMLKVPER